MVVDIIKTTNWAYFKNTNECQGSVWKGKVCFGSELDMKSGHLPNEICPALISQGNSAKEPYSPKLQ